MIEAIINPNDPIEEQNEKLIKIIESLMTRVERETDASGAAYAQFQRAAVLEDEVRARTKELEQALDLLNESNSRLASANAETEKARSNLTSAIESIQEGFALFDPSGRLVMCNSRFGMHMPDIHEHLVPGLLFNDYVRMVSESTFLNLPDDTEASDWAAQRMQRHESSHVMFNVQMIWDRWVQVSEHRTFDGGTVVLQTDVSDIMRIERQERERMLDDQARLIRATLEHLDQGVCIFDKQGRMVGWNQRLVDLLPLPISLMRMGARFETLMFQLKDRVKFSHGMNAEQLLAWVNSETSRAPIRFEATHGQNITLDAFAQEMPDQGFVISFTDVSSERDAVKAFQIANETLEQRVLDRTLELEDALSDAERANASKTRFVAAASHDLLQPLSAAKLYFASIENSSVPDETKEIIVKATRALGSVEGILEALLDISKLDSGRIALDVRPVSLRKLLKQLGEELAPLAKQKGLSLRIIPADLTVISDNTYLRRILQNLIVNAIRYTDSGKVLVGVRKNGGSASIQVWDTGPGIPEDKQEVIFGEFQRLNASASAAEGMGLGLAIVERACAILKHPLRVQSRVGLGTAFIVDAPITEPDQTHNTSLFPYAKITEMPSLGNLVVLLMENDLALQNALSITLEGWGVDVLTATTATQARELLTEIELCPDVILADYQLDDGEFGTDAIFDIRNIHGSVPAAILTANRSSEISALCKKNKLQLLHKPIEPDTLRQFLASLSRRQKPS